MKTFPDLIKEIRKELGMTQKQLATRLDVSYILISMVETGQKKVSKKLVIKLAKLLDVHPMSLSPFLFAEIKQENLSPLEKSLMEIGEKLQEFLIKKRAKEIKNI